MDKYYPSGPSCFVRTVAGAELNKLGYKLLIDNLEFEYLSAVDYHLSDSATCVGWSNGSGNCLVDISLETYRQKCLRNSLFYSPSFCKELFLTHELYSWLHSNSNNIID